MGGTPGYSLPPMSDGTTLVDHLRRQVRTRGGAVAMHFSAGERWAPITWSQMGVAVDRLAAYLLEESVTPGDHVAIWGGNRPEWHIADAAILSVRARPVPVYPTLSAEQAAYVLGHSEAAVAVVETPEVLERILSVRDRLAGCRRVVVMQGLDAPDAGGFAIPWAVALERGQAALELRRGEVTRLGAQARPEDIATLIYTSGTTGPPKAVQLTHRNILATMASISSIVSADADDRILSYLPLAHIAERMNSEFRSYVFGNATWFSRGIERLAEDLVEVRPTLFFGVPRIWEKMAARVGARLDAARGPRGALARWAAAQGRQALDARERGAGPGRLARRRLALADRLVLARLRATLGLDQARVLVSGAAPIDPEVLRRLGSLGLPVLEVYGQTEDTGATSMVRSGTLRIGTVGPPFPGVDLRIAEDGEILVRGDNVFAGYHKDPEATAEAMTEDGYLRTGDIGELDPDGSLRITDRKKDLIITAGGKNIAPAVIESALKRHPLVGNAVAIGDRRPYVSALLTLDADEARAWAQARGLAGPGTAELVAEPALREELQRHVDAVNAELSQVEQVKRWQLLDVDFTPGEELTPTLKVRRSVVAERHAAAIEANYAGARSG